MHLHDWNADFAAWCSYKYLNCGPGAVAGAWIHERHAARYAAHDAQATTLPRFAGWWGNDPATRFAMGPEFHARPDAEGWQLSNPPILALAPAKASIAIFDEVGMAAIRAKSLLLTGYMEFLLDRLPPGRVKVLTPRDSGQRGAQLSLQIPGAGQQLEKALHDRGVIVDYREPDVIRAAPTALYNSFTDVHRFVDTLREVLAR
jgi:kynureninase